MRKKKNRDSRFENCSHLASITPFENKGKWKEFFGNDNPVHIEIGCGKGAFITALAEQNKNINYVAMEKCLDVIILAMEKINKTDLKNVCFIHGDANDLLEIFEENEA